MPADVNGLYLCAGFFVYFKRRNARLYALKKNSVRPYAVSGSKVERLSYAFC